MQTSSHEELMQELRKSWRFRFLYWVEGVRFWLWMHLGLSTWSS